MGMSQDFFEHLTALLQTFLIGRVHDKYEAVGIGIIMSPSSAELIATSDIVQVNYTSAIPQLSRLETDCGSFRVGVVADQQADRLRLSGIVESG